MAAITLPQQDLRRAGGASGSQRSRLWCRTATPRESLSLILRFIKVINNTLLPHLRSVFDLNYVEMTLIESVTAIGQL